MYKEIWVLVAEGETLNVWTCRQVTYLGNSKNVNPDDMNKNWECILIKGGKRPRPEAEAKDDGEVAAAAAAASADSSSDPVMLCVGGGVVEGATSEASAAEDAGCACKKGKKKNKDDEDEELSILQLARDYNLPELAKRAKLQITHVKLMPIPEGGNTLTPRHILTTYLVDVYSRHIITTVYHDISSRHIITT